MKFYNLIQTVLSVLPSYNCSNCSKTREATEEGWFILARGLVPNITNNSSVLLPILTQQYGVLFPLSSVELITFCGIHHSWGSRTCAPGTEHHHCSSLFCDRCSPNFCLAWSLLPAAKKDDDTIPYNLFLGYSGNRALRRAWIALLLTDTSQFHTHGLDGCTWAFTNFILSRMSC